MDTDVSPTRRLLSKASANWDDDGNVRDLEKKLSIIVFATRLFLTWLKCFPCPTKLYCFHGLYLKKSDCGNVQVQCQQAEAVEIAREARPPRDHVNSTYPRAPLVFCK